MKLFPPTKSNTVRPSSLKLQGTMCLAATLLTLLASRGVAAEGPHASAAPVPGTAAKFRRPLAEGLPSLPDPVACKRAWHSKLELRGGMMLRDGEPFFPIGYVCAQHDDQLAESVAMGCNAAHFDIGWNVTQWVRERAIPLPPRCRKRVNSLYLPASPFRAPGDPMTLAPCGEDALPPTPEADRNSVKKHKPSRRK